MFSRIEISRKRRKFMPTENERIERETSIAMRVHTHTLILYFIVYRNIDRVVGFFSYLLPLFILSDFILCSSISINLSILLSAFFSFISFHFIWCSAVCVCVCAFFIHKILLVFSLLARSQNVSIYFCGGFMCFFFISIPYYFFSLALDRI